MTHFYKNYLYDLPEDLRIIINKKLFNNVMDELKWCYNNNSKILLISNDLLKFNSLSSTYSYSTSKSLENFRKNKKAH